MTGQDVERGTFSQHHAVFYDVRDGSAARSLAVFFRKSRAAFEIYNSPLSENAALAFEYGYNIQEPHRLVIWEAQYGDFINNAQACLRGVHGFGEGEVGTDPFSGASAAARL
jgi:2-oxoglutarate dehydrogenase E1 component